MSNQPGPNQSQGASGAAAPALPDLNAETYPFSMVQHLIDQAAYINAYATCGANRANAHIQATAGTNIGFDLNGTLHRFDINLEQPAQKSGVRAANVVGRSIGEFTHRWLLIPGDFSASPDRNPAPTPLDTSRSQRFVMEDGVFKFGESGFRGFGTGATYPVNSGGKQQLLAAAVGEVLDGYGKFEGLEGSYVLSGEITTQGAFEGNLQIRVLDSRGQIRTDSDVGPSEGTLDSSSNLSYLMFRGQKTNENVKTNYIFGPGGMPAGFKLKQELRIVDLRSHIGRSRRLRSSVRLGQVIGWMSSEVFLNILDPGAPGTSLAPIPFSSYNVFTFLDDAGNTIGSFTAEGGEGRSFNVKLPGAPGQQALRFGAFQTLTKGSGCFEGVRGLFTDNSIVGVAPHVTSTLYTACICDPEGKFRAK